MHIPIIANNLVRRFGDPYTTDKDCLRLLFIIFDEAVTALQDTGYAIYEDGMWPLESALHDVVCANRDILQDNKIPPDNNTWKQVNKFNLLSPYIDFRGVVPMWDDERKHYVDRLEQLMYKLYPNIYVEDSPPRAQYPIRYILALYDIWLQAVVSWSNSYEVLTNGIKEINNQSCHDIFGSKVATEIRETCKEYEERK